MTKPKVLFLSSKETLPILEELALLVTSPPGEDWAISHLWPSDVFKPGKTFLGCLLETAKEVDFAVILVSPDDQAVIRTEAHSVPRDNVIFEAGLCIAELDPENAVIVVENRETPVGRVGPKLPSDLSGIVHFDLSLPEGYQSLEPEQRSTVIRAALNPVKKKVQSHLLERFAKETLLRTARQDSIPTDVLVLESRPTGRIIPLYYDLRDDLNWFKEMAGYLKPSQVILPSELAYYGPGLAYQWIGAAGQGPGNAAQARAFENAVSNILTINMNSAGRSAPLTVVDLGIGDFSKGERILQELLTQSLGEGLRLRYVAYDISSEMICTALGINSGRNATVETLKQPGNDVLGITAPFEKLGNYKDLLGKDECLFLLLGNTLGNELHEEGMLNSISEVMKRGDKLILEVQLKEVAPIPTEVITESFRKDLQFYAGPLLAFGCPEDNISLEVVADLAPKGDVDCWTYYCQCAIKATVKRYIAPLRDFVQFGGGDTVITTYVVRKYSEHALDSVMNRARLNVVQRLPSPPIGEWKRRFYYIVAQKL